MGIAFVLYHLQELICFLQCCSLRVNIVIKKTNSV